MILIDTVKNRTIGRLTDIALVCLDLVDGVDLVDCVDLVDSGIADGEPAGNSLAMTKNEKEFSLFYLPFQYLLNNVFGDKIGCLRE